MPRIVTRAEWGARAPKSTPIKVGIGARTATCVHHDGANVITVRSFAEACARVRADQNYHMDSNGWDDIGYNYLVISAPGTDVDGLVFEGRGRDVVGAHCLNWNTPWIGIQVAIGGGQTPSPASLSSVRWLHDTFTAAAGHALAKKVHSDGFPTACPDPYLRNWVKAGMPVGVLTAVKLAVITPITRKVVIVLVGMTLSGIAATAGVTLPHILAANPALRAHPNAIHPGDRVTIPATPPKATPKKAIAKPKAVVKVVTKAPAKLVVDGNFGPLSKKRLQRWAGVAQDGDLGPISWRAIQRKVGSPADGIPGPNTWKAIQRMVSSPADGKPGPDTYRHLQAFLNSH